MVMTDPIADMLTRIRNANSVYHDKVEIPGSKIKEAIALILKNEEHTGLVLAEIVISLAMVHLPLFLVFQFHIHPIFLCGWRSLCILPSHISRNKM